MKKIVGFIAGLCLAFGLSACNLPASEVPCEEISTGSVVDDSYCEDGLAGYEWAQAEEQVEEEEDGDHDKKKSKSKSKVKSGFKKK